MSLIDTTTIWEKIEGAWKTPSAFTPYLPALAIAVSSGFKAAGLLSQGKAGVTAASRDRQAALYSQEQARATASNIQGAAQRDAHFKGLEGDLVISAIKARAGAGGSSDPTVLNLIAQASARRAYNMQMTLYGGADKARALTEQAKANVYAADTRLLDAKYAKRGSTMAAVAALASGGASLHRYWPKGKDDPLGGISDLQAGADPDLDYSKS